MTTWEQLTIYVGESDQWQGKSVYTALIEAARKQKIAGATVIRGIEGYGFREQGKIHTARILELSSELPMVIYIIDRAEAIAQFLPLVKEIVTKGLVVQQTLNIVHHSSGNPIG